MRKQVLGLTGLTLGLGLVAGSAVAGSNTTVYDFSGLTHASNLSGVPGLSISAINDNPDTVGQAIVWDYNARPDLAYGGHYGPALSGGNVGGGVELGNGVALKGAEGTKNTLEGRRSSGSLIFKLDRPVTSLQLTVVDVEGPEEFNANSGFFLDFFSNGTEIGSVGLDEIITPGNAFYDSTVAYGNGTVNRLGAFQAADFGVTSFDSFLISLGGSETVAQITTTAVPTPSALLGGLCLMGFAAARRRRSSEVLDN